MKSPEENLIDEIISAYHTTRMCPEASGHVMSKSAVQKAFHAMRPSTITPEAHDKCVTELLEANNREVERRRRAEARILELEKPNSWMFILQADLREDRS
jgi:hypothetical protein